MIQDDQTPNTAGNSFRINDQELHSYPLTLVIHDAHFIDWTAEGQRLFGGKYPYAYLGTSGWVGKLTNRVTMEYDDPLMRGFTDTVLSCGEFGAIVLALSESAMCKPGISELCTGLRERFPAAHFFVLQCDDRDSGGFKREFSRRWGFEYCPFASGKDALQLLERIQNLISQMPAPKFYDHFIREGAEWYNIALARPEDTPEHRVLIVGDSISRGYGALLAERLPGWHVDQFHTSESIAHPAFYRLLQLLLTRMPYEVIHINNGLHVHGITPARYREHLTFLLQWIRMLSPDTKIVFAATTPMAQKESEDRNEAFDGTQFKLGDRDPLAQSRCKPTGYRYSPQASELFREFNSIARELCDSFGIAFNNLYDLCVSENLPQADAFHFLQPGYEVLANAVARYIREAACKK